MALRLHRECHFTPPLVVLPLLVLLFFWWSALDDPYLFETWTESDEQVFFEMQPSQIDVVYVLSDWNTTYYDVFKYSLRSLEKNLQWVRRVFVVTSSTRLPEWLETSANDLRLVTIEASCPELNLHRIPDLSPYFLYMRPQTLIGQTVYINDFYDTAKGFLYSQHTFLEDCSEDCSWHMVNNGNCDAACRNTACQLDGTDCDARVIPPITEPLTSFSTVLNDGQQSVNRFLNEHYWFEERRMPPVGIPLLVPKMALVDLHHDFPDLRESHVSTRLDFQMLMHYYIHYKTVQLPLDVVLRRADTDGDGRFSPVELRRIMADVDHRVAGRYAVDFLDVYGACFYSNSIDYNVHVLGDEEDDVVGVEEFGRCAGMRELLALSTQRTVKYRHVVQDAVLDEWYGMAHSAVDEEQFEEMWKRVVDTEWLPAVFFYFDPSDLKFLSWSSFSKALDALRGVFPKMSRFEKRNYSL